MMRLSLFSFNSADLTGGSSIKRHSAGADLEIDKGSSGVKHDDEGLAAQYHGIQPSFIQTAENLLDSLPSDKKSSKPEPAKVSAPTVHNPKGQRKAVFSPTANFGDNGDICLYDEEAAPAASQATANEYLPW
jgi:hypothetical protein